MSAVAIVRAVLVASSNMLASVPAARIVSGIVPKGTALPCVGITDVVLTEQPTIDAHSITTLVDGRVQVTVMAANYASKKAILDVVRKALNYERGDIAGFQVVSIKRVLVGPDFSNTDAGIHMQSIDFSVVFNETA